MKLKQTIYQGIGSEDILKKSIGYECSSSVAMA